MVAVSSSFSPGYPIALGTQLPPGATLPMQAAALSIGYMQLATLDASGNAALNDGTVPGLVCAGVGMDKLGDTNAVAAVAKTNGWQGMVGLPFSALSGDGFSAADLGGVPCFIASESTIGRKSNVSGNNRSLFGVCFGLNDDGLARAWGGPVAQMVARAMLTANGYPLGRFGIADASASTAISERSIQRPKIKGTVLDVTFTGAAVAASNTDYATVTFAVRSLATSYGTSVTFATYDTRITGQGAIAAFTPTALTLPTPSALFLLDTDVLTVVTTKGGAGQVLTGEFLINGKAI